MAKKILSICGSFIKIPIQEIGWFWPTYFLCLPFALGILATQRKVVTNRPRGKEILLPLLMAVLLVVIAEVSYNAGLEKGLVAIIAPIGGSSATLSVLLCFLIFKDPITRQQKLGILTTLVGIVFLSFVSV